MYRRIIGPHDPKNGTPAGTQAGDRATQAEAAPRSVPAGQVQACRNGSADWRFLTTAGCRRGIYSYFGHYMFIFRSFLGRRSTDPG